MQISQFLQNTYTTNSQAITPSQQSLASADALTTKQTDSINKSAYNYFELSEDVSQYTEIDPVQEQTNKDIINLMSSFINNDTDEGKKNLEAFDTRKYASSYVGEIITKEITALIESGAFEDSEISSNYMYNEKTTIKELEDTLNNLKNNENLPINLNRVLDGHKTISTEESATLNVERFKNLYSFTDEFAQTDKFLELYDEYRDQKGNQMSEIDSKVSANWSNFTDSTNSEAYFSYVDPTEYITAEVVKNAFSKSEAIEHYTNISNELKEHIANDNTGSYIMGSHYKNQMQETVDLYDTIASGLKDMWGFGDLDVNA